MHPPFSFRLAEKKTGRARSKRKGAFGRCNRCGDESVDCTGVRYTFSEQGSAFPQLSAEYGFRGAYRTVPAALSAGAPTTTRAALSEAGSAERGAGQHRFCPIQNQPVRVASTESLCQAGPAPHGGTSENTKTPLRRTKAVFSSTGRGAFSFAKTKENGGRISLRPPDGGPINNPYSPHTSRSSQ